MRKVLLGIAAATMLGLSACSGGGEEADTGTEAAVPPAPSAVGDTAIPPELAPADPAAEPPAQDLIPSNE